MIQPATDGYIEQNSDMLGSEIEQRLIARIRQQDATIAELRTQLAVAKTALVKIADAQDLHWMTYREIASSAIVDAEMHVEQYFDRDRYTQIVAALKAAEETLAKYDDQRRLIDGTWDSDDVLMRRLGDALAAPHVAAMLKEQR